jgi:carbamoyl-phosphate synthase small subunit
MGSNVQPNNAAHYSAHHPKLKLILKDGTEIVGQSFGYASKKEGWFVDGEVVFNTGMVGYPETFTDPSYRGQILVLTYPLIGNYGVPMEKGLHHVSQLLESEKIHLRGLIVSEYSPGYSHWQAKQSLADFLTQHKIPAIQGVDTRALTQKLREHGVMLGKIVSDDTKFSKMMEFTDPNSNNLVAEVSCKKKEVLEPTGKAKATIALIDCGIKHNIFRSFLDRGVRVIRLPWNYDLSKLENNYDGLFISNGPGDPKLAIQAAESVRHAMKMDKPIFGICLGLQIMALAVGANTYKLKYGHRSCNQPCTDLKTGRCLITSQNHGYAVDAKTLPKDWGAWMKNENDGTVEGIQHKTKPWSAVQFHPEASPGPEDAAYLFDEFVGLLAK